MSRIKQSTHVRQNALNDEVRKVIATLNDSSDLGPTLGDGETSWPLGGEIAARLKQRIDALEGVPSQNISAALPNALIDDALDKEVIRWQDALDKIVRDNAPEANIDGGGADSGDPLDFTLAEIGQAFAYWQNRAFDALQEMGLSSEGYASDLEALCQIFPNDSIDVDTDELRATVIRQREQIKELLSSQGVSSTAAGVSSPASPAVTQERWEVTRADNGTYIVVADDDAGEQVISLEFCEDDACAIRDAHNASLRDKSKEFLDFILRTETHWRDCDVCRAVYAELMSSSPVKQPSEPTDAEIAQFLKEFDEGKHPLSPEDEAALERARPELFRRLKLIWQDSEVEEELGKPDASSESVESTRQKARKAAEEWFCGGGVRTFTQRSQAVDALAAIIQSKL